MLDKTITFGGEQIPAYIASVPQMVRPTRKGTVTQIAGTNREVVEMEYAWEAYDQTYTMVVGDGSEDSVNEAIDAVARVLYKDGWQKLSDSYDTDHFRLAYFKESWEVENRYTRLGKFDITFHCRPERFLTTGETPVAVTSGGTITNPTTYKAKPLIHITGSGSGTLTISGITMSFTGIVDYLNIDCDTMDVYRLASENRNNLMTGEFPVLYAGSNSVAFTGGITSVTITPRWWII